MLELAKTGDIDFTTVGHSSGDSYSIILEMIKSMTKDAYESDAGDRGSEILAAQSRMQDMQRPGGIGGLLGRFRRPMFPPMGGFGGFGGGGFGPPPFNPMMYGGFPGMYGGFPGMGGGFFGGFRPRLRRRRRQRPDFSDLKTIRDTRI